MDLSILDSKTAKAMVVLVETTTIPRDQRKGATASTTAIYLPDLHVLAVTQESTGNVRSDLTEQRTALIVDSHSAAVRAAVKTADAWVAKVTEDVDARIRADAKP